VDSDVIHEFEFDGRRCRVVLSHIENEDPYDINVLPAGSDVDWIISVNRKGWAEVQYENNDEDFFQLIEDNVPRIIRNMGV